MTSTYRDGGFARRFPILEQQRLSDLGLRHDLEVEGEGDPAVTARLKLVECLEMALRGRTWAWISLPQRLEWQALGPRW